MEVVLDFTSAQVKAITGLSGMVTTVVTGCRGGGGGSVLDSGRATVK